MQKSAISPPHALPLPKTIIKQKPSLHLFSLHSLPLHLHFHPQTLLLPLSNHVILSQTQPNLEILQNLKCSYFSQSQNQGKQQHLLPWFQVLLLHLLSFSSFSDSMPFHGQISLFSPLLFVDSHHNTMHVFEMVKIRDQTHARSENDACMFI